MARGQDTQDLLRKLQCLGGTVLTLKIADVGIVGFHKPTMTAWLGAGIEGDSGCAIKVCTYLELSSGRRANGRDPRSLKAPGSSKMEQRCAQVLVFEKKRRWRAGLGSRAFLSNTTSLRQ